MSLLLKSISLFVGVSVYIDLQQTGWYTSNIKNNIYNDIKLWKTLWWRISRLIFSKNESDCVFKLKARVSLVEKEKLFLFVSSR